MSWLYYALASSVLFAICAYIDKFVIDKRVKDPVAITLFGGLSSLVIAAGIFLFSGFKVIVGMEFILILLAGAFLFFYLFPYFKALSLDETSRVVPIFQLCPVLTLILSFVFLGEKLTLQQLGGFVLIVAGGFILGTDSLSLGIFKPRKAMFYIMLASVLYSVTGVIFKFVYNTTDFWTVVAYEYVGSGLGAVVLLFSSRFRKILTGEFSKMSLSTFLLVLAAQTLAVAAGWAISFAYTLTSVSLVSVIEGTYPFFILLFGLILSIWFPQVIKEDISKSAISIKVISVALMFVGLLLI